MFAIVGSFVFYSRRGNFETNQKLLSAQFDIGEKNDSLVKNQFAKKNCQFPSEMHLIIKYENNDQLLDH